jgi:hypothetical protein
MQSNVADRQQVHIYQTQRRGNLKSDVKDIVLLPTQLKRRICTAENNDREKTGSPESRDIWLQLCSMCPTVSAGAV